MERVHGADLDDRLAKTGYRVFGRRDRDPVTDPIPESLRSRLSYLLGVLHRHALDLESGALAELDTGVKQHAALAVLADEGPMTQQELGQRLGIDRTTVVGVVDDLEGSGAVKRTRHPADRRAYLVTLASSGRNKLRKGQRVVDRVERTLLSALDEDERRTLTELLARSVSRAAADDQLGGEDDVAGR